MSVAEPDQPPARRPIQVGCAEAAGVALALVMSLFVLAGGVQARVIRPPLGRVQVGPLALVALRQLGNCTSPLIESCRDDFYVLRAGVGNVYAPRRSVQLLRVPLK